MLPDMAAINSVIGQVNWAMGAPSPSVN